MSHGPTPEALTLEEKHHFLLRKLHSLSGIVPIGAFLIEHLLTNSLAFLGPDKFNKAVHSLHDLPFLTALEVFGIFLPLAFHAVYGIKIAMTAQPNVQSYPYMANRRYTLQRITGYIAFLFLIIHLFKFRFAHVIGWNQSWPTDASGNHIAYVGAADPYQLTWLGINQWNLWGWMVPPLLVTAIYLVGLWAACYHFANGIWSFCISWGITVGEKAQKRVGMAAAALGIVLFLWGSLSLFALNKPVPTKSSSTHGPSPVAASIE